MGKKIIRSLKLFFFAREIVRRQNRELYEIRAALENLRDKLAAKKLEAALWKLKALGIQPQDSRGKTRRAGLS